MAPATTGPGHGLPVCADGHLETYRGAVYPWHCDHMGHMNVMWYVGKFDEGTWNLVCAFGITPGYLKENHRGMAAVKQEITYQRELHAGDIVAVRSRLIEVRDKVLRFAHEMRNAETGEVSATTELTVVHIDTRARKGVALEPRIAARARALLESQPPQPPQPRESRP